MPLFDTKYGQKEFSYSSLEEYKNALHAQAEKVIQPYIKTHDFFGETITEVDVGAMKKGTCAFGSEFSTISALIQMLEAYEESDSPHSIVDFYNQNQDQYLIFGSRARINCVKCHGLQTQYKELLKKEHDSFMLLLLIAQMNSLLDQATSYNNTSLVTSLSNMVIEKGQEGLDHLSSFHDTFTKDLNETIAEVNELIGELE